MHPGQVHAVEARASRCRRRRRRCRRRPGRAGRRRRSTPCRTSAIAVVLPQQPAELREGRGLVVDDERTQGRTRGASGGVLRAAVLRIAGGGASHGQSLRRGVDARGVLGHPEGHLRACPGRGLDDQAEVVAVDLPQPGVDVAEADAVAVALAVEDGPDRLRVASPTPSSSMVITASAPSSLAVMRDVAAALLASPARAGRRSPPAVGRRGRAPAPAAPRGR